MLLSVLVSMGLWVFVTFKQDPEVTNTLSNIPVTVQEAPTGMVVQSETSSVQVQVSAPSDVWAQLKPEEFKAQVDASKVTPGLQEVPVKVTSSDPRVRIRATEPSEVFLKVEKLETKNVPVEVVPSGAVPFGYQSGTPSVTPGQVQISGPESAVNQVKSVAVNVSLDGVTQSIDQTVAPTPQNVSSADAAQITVNPAKVLVDVPINQKLSYKTVPIQVNLAGQVALGYQIVGETVDPQTVTLVGDPEALKQLTTVPTQPIDVTGADGDRAYDTSLQLPKTVAMERSQSIVVRVLVSTVNGSETILVSPKVTNLAPNLNYTITPGAVNVTLSGPIPILSRIQPSDIAVTVNASGITSGTHKLTVQVKNPDLLNVVHVEPQTVTFTVK